MTANESPTSFNVLDWVGVVASSFAVLGLLGFPVAGTLFRTLYSDFGSEPLPLLTTLATSSWFPPALGLACGAALVSGAMLHRRALVVAAFAVASMGIALCLVGMYLPMFAMARAIAP